MLYGTQYYVITGIKNKLVELQPGNDQETNQDKEMLKSMTAIHKDPDNSPLSFQENQITKKEITTKTIIVNGEKK